MAALACLSFVAGCDTDRSHVDCSANAADGKCLDTLLQHQGFEIGMTKQAALKNACELATQNKIWNPVFLVNGALRAHPGVSMCKLESEAYGSDQWSFIESAWFRERYIQLKFDDNKIALIRLLPRGWDP